MKNLKIDKIEIIKVLTVLILFFILLIPLPYTIILGGGTIDVSKRIEIDNKNLKTNRFQIAYVSELKGNVLTYTLGKLNPYWEVESILDYAYDEKESPEDIERRHKLDLETSLKYATKVAYEAAEKEIEIIDEKMLLYYIIEENRQGLKVGDEFISYDDKKLEKTLDLLEYVQTKEIGDEIKLKFKRGKKIIEKNVKVYLNEDKEKRIGIALQKSFDIKAKPPIKFSFKDNEQGSSAGIIIALSIYDALMKNKDRGLVVGSGSLDSEGKISPIGGVKYKMHGAHKAKAKYFIVADDNYEEAKKVLKEKKYKFKLIKANTLKEAIINLDK